MIDLIFIAGCALSGVHPETIQAIIKVESGFKASAININSNGAKAVPALNKKEAISLASSLIAKGFNIDMGLMQINSIHLKSRGISIAELFDPCRNIALGSEILKENYELAVKSLGPGQKALRAALSAYNTGKMQGERGRNYLSHFYKAPIPPDPNQAEIKVTFVRN